MTKAIMDNYYTNPIDELSIMENKYTPFCAIELNDYELFVNLLTVDLSKNIHMINESGQTLLMKAIEKENIPMVRCLINNGTDIYQMDYNYDMAEDYAKIAKNKDILQILLCRIQYEEMEWAKKKRC